MPLRAFSTRLFPNTVTIRSVTHGIGSRGGDQATPASGTSVACRVLATDRPNREVSGQVVGQTRFEIRFPADPNVATDDRIDWGGRILSCLAPATDMGGEGRSWRVYAVEIV